MNVQRWIKLPFRVARGVVRGLRAEFAPRDAAPAAAPPPAREPPPVPAPELPPAPAPPAPPRAPVEVRVEQTPNPDALKFVCDATVVPEGSIALNEPENAAAIPFARAIFAIEGIRTVFATRNFVTVTRKPEGPGWDVLRPAIVAALQEHVGR